jgi:hypothetical protein
MMKIVFSIVGIAICVALLSVLWPLIIAGGVLGIGALILLAPLILLCIIVAKLFKKKS